VGRKEATVLTIELSNVLRAPLADLWSLISDPQRQASFVGYEITFTEPIRTTRLGPEYRWIERGFLLGRPYDCEIRVLGWEPPQWFCFGTPNLFQVSYELDDHAEGTALRYRVELPRTHLELESALTDVSRHTLSNLKILVEGAAPAGAFLADTPIAERSATADRVLRASHAA
jgi:hypothetical protein